METILSALPDPGSAGGLQDVRPPAQVPSNFRSHRAGVSNVRGAQGLGSVRDEPRGPAPEELAAGDVHCVPPPLPGSASSPFRPSCLPLSECYFHDRLSGTVKLKVEQKLEQIGKLHGVSLHTAHVLCMDAILSVGLEMGSHNPDCWPHVFRCMTGPPPHVAPTLPREPGGDGRARLQGLPALEQMAVTRRVWVSPK